MKSGRWIDRLGWLVTFTLLGACVDHIHFDIPEAQFQTVVEGLISDNPGPYTVLVNAALNLDADSVVLTPIEHLSIKLLDDEGNSEDLKETTPGVYNTGGLIRGKADHSYYIRITTPEGHIFESQPDKIRAIGELQDIRFEYEARTVEYQYGVLPADVFNIYINGNAGESAANGENYVRWRYTGTYEVLTFPALHYIWAEGFRLPDPFPCSGVGFDASGSLVGLKPCECCTCWVNNYESQPQLSDGQYVVNNQYNNIKVAEVPINTQTFYNKYHVNVEQMSLSRTAFDFFKLIRAQKSGASSLFQPPSGEIKGNITPVNNEDRIVGLFWATSVKSKSFFIQRSDVPYPLTEVDQNYYPCTTYKNSTTTKPAYWQ